MFKKYYFRGVEVTTEEGVLFDEDIESFTQMAKWYDSYVAEKGESPDKIKVSKDNLERYESMLLDPELLKKFGDDYNHAK